VKTGEKEAEDEHELLREAQELLADGRMLNEAILVIRILIHFVG